MLVAVRRGADRAFNLYGQAILEFVALTGFEEIPYQCAGALRWWGFPSVCADPPLVWRGVKRAA